TPRNAARPPTTISALMTTARTGRRTNRPASLAPWAFCSWIDIAGSAVRRLRRGLARGRLPALALLVPALSALCRLLLAGGRLAGALPVLGGRRRCARLVRLTLTGRHLV